MVNQVKTEKQLPQMVDCAEVAAILGISTRTVWRLIASHELPEPLRIGRSVRWRLIDIERWIEARVSAPSPGVDLRRRLH